MENGASDKSKVSYSNRVIMDFDSQVESHSQDFITFLIGSIGLPSPHVIMMFNFSLNQSQATLTFMVGGLLVYTSETGTEGGV